MVEENHDKGLPEESLCTSNAPSDEERGSLRFLNWLPDNFSVNNALWGFSVGAGIVLGGWVIFEGSSRLTGFPPPMLVEAFRQAFLPGAAVLGPVIGLLIGGFRESKINI